MHFRSNLNNKKREMKSIFKRFSVFVALCSISMVMLAQTPVKTSFVSGSDKGGKESADKVTDGRKFSKWCLDNEKKMPYFVVLSVGETPIVLKEYLFTTGDDTASYPDRNPATWVVYGSNDMKTWKVLDEKNSHLRMGAMNAQDYYFPVKPKDAYKFFKFEFHEMQEGTRIQLSEISLMK